MALTALFFTVSLAACAAAESSSFAPPPLTLKYDGVSMPVPPGSYFWSCPPEDGAPNREEARSEPSFQSWEDTPQVDAATISLHFQGEPDRVTVQRWEMDAAMDDVQPESLPIRVNIHQDTVEQLLDLEPGRYGYAVTLYWEESESLSGSASYYFHTVKPEA